MSPHSEVIEKAASLDWNIVAAAAAIFLGTLVTTIAGWFKGKRNISTRERITDSFEIGGVSLQDNQTLREATIVNREIRDQLLLNHNVLTKLCRAMDDNTAVHDDILNEMKSRRRREHRQEDS